MGCREIFNHGISHVFCQSGARFSFWNDRSFSSFEVFASPRKIQIANAYYSITIILWFYKIYYYFRRKYAISDCKQVRYRCAYILQVSGKTWGDGSFHKHLVEWKQMRVQSIQFWGRQCKHSRRNSCCSQGFVNPELMLLNGFCEPRTEANLSIRIFHDLALHGRVILG